jgi:hypothetical protein
MLECVSACCYREWRQLTLAVAGGRKRVEEGRVRDGGVEEDKAARRSSVGWWKEGLRGSLRGLLGLLQVLLLFYYTTETNTKCLCMTSVAFRQGP